MPIVKTLDFSDFRNEFHSYRRNNFSEEALQVIFDYLEDCYSSDNFEIDVISICCDFREYNSSEMLTEYAIEIEPDMTEENIIDVIRDFLNDQTIIAGEFKNPSGETVFVFMAF